MPQTPARGQDAAPAPHVIRSDAPLDALGESEFADLYAEHNRAIYYLALRLLGDPQKLASPHVHYPQVLGVSGQNDEKTHFEWFVANDDRDGAHRSLAPITLKDEVLPTLPRLPKREKGRPPGGPRGGPSRDRFPPRPWR